MLGHVPSPFGIHPGTARRCVLDQEAVQAGAVQGLGSSACVRHEVYEQIANLCFLSLMLMLSCLISFK